VLVQKATSRDFRGLQRTSTGFTGSLDQGNSKVFIGTPKNLSELHRTLMDFTGLYGLHRTLKDFTEFK
jgi:hypothetical protein